MKINSTIFVFLLIFTTLSIADPASEYNDGTSTANQQQQSALSQIKNFNPGSVPNFTTSPPQAGYQNNPNQMQNDAAAAAAADPTTQAIINSIPKQIQLNSNSAGMQQAQAVQNNAQNISNGISTSAFNCQQPICTISYKMVNCVDMTSENTCQPYFDQGCTEVTSNNGNVTMSCPITNCSGKTQNVCGSGGQYCLNGECYKSTPIANGDFAKAGSEFAAASAAAAEGAKDPTQQFIFAGQGLSCSDKWLGSITCCSDHGWVNHAIPALAGCTDEEKQLGVAREKGLAIGLGSYCSHHAIFNICTETRESYCTFPDYISYDVQSQGREGQLHIPFGDAENPNCSGLTIGQIQSIDFSKIDFSNFYSSYQNGTQFPDPNAISQQITNDINKEINGG